MFGRSLEETMQVEARLGGAFIPVLIHRCVRFLRENGGPCISVPGMHMCAIAVKLFIQWRVLLRRSLFVQGGNGLGNRTVCTLLLLHVGLNEIGML